MENRKGIVVINVVDEPVEEGQAPKSKLTAEVYLESENGKGKKTVTKHEELLEDSDLEHLVTLARPLAASMMKDYDSEKDIIEFNYSSNLVGMIVGNEITNFKSELITELATMKNSLAESGSLMIDLTDEQKAFIPAFGKAINIVIEKLSK